MYYTYQRMNDELAANPRIWFQVSLVNGVEKLEKQGNYMVSILTLLFFGTCLPCKICNNTNAMQLVKTDWLKYTSLTQPKFCITNKKCTTCKLILLTKTMHHPL